MFLVDGGIVSIEDWNWTCSAKDIPFPSKASKQLVWRAENAVAHTHKIVLYTRKRVRDAATWKLRTRSEGTMIAAAFLKSFACRDVSVTVGRGFGRGTLKVAERCKLSAGLAERCGCSRAIPLLTRALCLLEQLQTLGFTSWELSTTAHTLQSRHTKPTARG